MTTPRPMSVEDSLPRPTETARWVLPVLAPIVLVAVAAAALVGPGAVWAELSAAVLWAALLLGLLAPVAYLAGRKAPGALLASAVAGAFLVLTVLSTALPRFGVFADLEWNWQGKLLDLAWVGLLFLVLRHWATAEAGLRWRCEPGSLRPVFIFILAAFLVPAGSMVLAGVLEPGSVPSPSVERVLFDASVPNLTEELIWRGAMLAVLDRVLGTPWRFFGAPVGWGLVLTSLGFGLGHGVFLDPAAGVTVDVAAVLATGIAGVLMAWVRARTGSLWPAFLAHCAPELGVDIGSALAP
ncbi:membrane protease YdiL (CAAX protease family) [Actinoalloteichus hoggarensis]|uniref:CAAX amino terminal protease self-immunity n=1 Tax=Actinoalloteichus hoggarensis TaxID=1470176 RepID=A0A221VZ42_9PSEU|nr:CPBP family intramembrane glutamic endopeptidase [Actinoalloteichus hoggarensis]ASO18803.1 CAAX amino terminal protease self- immunity [Actinoalloteichus hoggarensis]MBB5920036.1 membrane protease YdiL (CAAX protease family) [Actinoalloteichus hoggarensis]